MLIGLFVDAFRFPNPEQVESQHLRRSVWIFIVKLDSSISYDVPRDKQFPSRFKSVPLNSKFLCPCHRFNGPGSDFFIGGTCGTSGRLLELVEVKVKPSLYYAEKIGKWRFHYENTWNVFRSHCAGKICIRNNHILDLRLRKTRWGKSQSYHDVIIFGKLCFKMFSVLTKTSNLSGCEECFVVFSVAGRSNGRKKLMFSNFSGVGNVDRAWMFNALVCFDVLLSFGDSLTFIESFFSGVSKTNFVYSVMLSICVLTM